jgi:hypothetical protein
MNRFARFGTALAASAVALVTTAGIALADPKDYRFEAVQPHVKAAGDVVVTLRLVHLPDGKPVEGAVIFSSKMEMPMGGMAPMVTKVSALKPSKSSEYPFQADFSMAGSYTLTVQAKVQGEAGTVTGVVPFMAMN